MEIRPRNTVATAKYIKVNVSKGKYMTMVHEKFKEVGYRILPVRNFPCLVSAAAIKFVGENICPVSSGTVKDLINYRI